MSHICNAHKQKHDCEKCDRKARTECEIEEETRDQKDDSDYDNSAAKPRRPNSSRFDEKRMRAATDPVPRLIAMLLHVAPLALPFRIRRLAVFFLVHGDL